MQTKVCSKCKKELPLERFGKNEPTKDGLNYRCKACDAEHSRQWKAANPEKVREQHWRKQSILLNGQPFLYSDYQQMLEEQGYKCCICGEGHNPDKQKGCLVPDMTTIQAKSVGCSAITAIRLLAF